MLVHFGLREDVLSVERNISESVVEAPVCVELFNLIGNAYAGILCRLPEVLIGVTQPDELCKVSYTTKFIAEVGQGWSITLFFNLPFVNGQSSLICLEAKQ